MRKDLKKIKKIVVKIGSEAIITKERELNTSKLKEICLNIKDIKEKGIEVIIVTSGAIGLGRKFLNDSDTKNIDYLQAASSVGQPRLFSNYLQEFEKLSLNCAQILLTHDDFKNKKRFLNAKNTISRLLANNIIPILNENDSISFEEITVGDNDELGAKISYLSDADLYLIISTTDGLYTKSPEEEGALPIPVVYSEDKITASLKSKSTLGRGGMASKIKAISKATETGIDVIVAGAHFTNPITRALEEDVGTYFYGKTEPKKDQWLVISSKSKCQIFIDDGCFNALKKNRSLLPSGITKVKGSFSRGDSVEIYFKNKIVAVGVSEYSSKELEKIKGHKTNEIKNILGYFIKDEAIHRNNLLLKV